MQSLTHGARQHPSSLCYTVASPLAERMAQCTWCGPRVGPVGLVRLVGRWAQDILCIMCFLNSGAHGTLYAEWRCSNMPAGATRLCIAPSAIGGSRAKRQPTTCQRVLPVCALRSSPLEARERSDSRPHASGCLPAQIALGNIEDRAVFAGTGVCPAFRRICGNLHNTAEAGAHAAAHQVVKTQFPGQPFGFHDFT